MDKALRARMEAVGYTVTETNGNEVGCCIQSDDNMISGKTVAVPAGALDESVELAVLHVEALDAGDPTPTVDDWLEAMAKSLGTAVDVQNTFDESGVSVSIPALRISEGTVWQAAVAAAESVAAQQGKPVVDVLADLRKSQCVAAVVVPK